MAPKRDDSKTIPTERTGDVSLKGDDAKLEVSNIGSEEDPNPHSGGGHRYAVRATDENTTLTAEVGEGDDIKTLVWTDPDALPGTSGDDPAETIRAVYEGGGAAVKAE